MSQVSPTEEYIQTHKDGSICAKGFVIGNVATGYWQWFRKAGSLMRSGYFADGIQIGEWTTYDKNGEVYKVTDMKNGKKNAPRTLIERN